MLPFIVSSPSPPSSTSGTIAARLPVQLMLSAPPSPFILNVNAPLTLTGIGKPLVLACATVPLAITVIVSAAAEPLMLTRSLPTPVMLMVSVMLAASCTRTSVPNPDASMAPALATKL